MVEIEFNFNQSLTNIQANLDSKFQDVITKYLQKSLLEPDSVCFLLNGKPINPNESIESHMSNLDRENKKMKILVTTIDKDDKDKEQVIVKSNDIICPQCKEPCRMEIENYKIKLFECVNGHITEGIKFNDFANTQKINESQIICDKCKIKNKGNCPKKEFYRCLICKQNLCLICRSNHDLSHNIILYDQKNYICKKHNEHLIKYCKQCKTNICFSCVDHNNHEAIFLGDLMPNIEEKKEFIKEIRSIIDSVSGRIKEIIKQLNEFMDNIIPFMKLIMIL